MMSYTAFDTLDPAVQRKVRAAEKRAGLKYGPQMLGIPNGRFVQVFLWVTFYGGEAWWIESADGKIPRRRLAEADRPCLREIEP